MTLSFSTKQKNFLCELASLSEGGNAPVSLELIDIPTLESVINRFKSQIALTQNKDIFSISPDENMISFHLESRIQGAVLRIIKREDLSEYISVEGIFTDSFGKPFFPG